jgi:hypothetical protein
MEEVLDIFENGRRPYIFEKGRQPHFFGKWKTATFLVNGRQPKYFPIGEDLIEDSHKRNTGTKNN